MSNSSITLPLDGVGKALDAELLAGSTYRERTQIAGALLAEVAVVRNSDPTATDYGLVTRNIGDTSATGATPVHLAASVSSQVLFASNTARLGATVTNDGSATLYLGFGVTPTITSYGVRIASYGYYEVPFGFTGAINAIWDVANGFGNGQEMS